MPFRYSGSKKRLLKHLPGPPFGVTRIVEPFAGSAAYSLAYKPSRVFLAEATQGVRALWQWLITTATRQDLLDLAALRAKEKIDVRKLNLDLPRETLLRLTSSGVYVGQLSSWALYPQHNVDFSKIISQLPYIKQHVDPTVRSDYRETTELDDGRTLFFVDPPYLGTQGNYQDKTTGNDQTKLLNSADVETFVRGLKGPVLMTYGDGAAETFPAFNWQLTCKRKVPIIRTGGTKERSEYHCWLNV